VIEDKQPPVLNPTVSNNGVIDCNNPTVTISCGITTPVSNITWKRNGITISTSCNAVVSVGGTYVVTATRQNGCVATTSVVVVGNQTTPTLSVANATLPCGGGSVILTANSNATDLTWNGPGIFNAKGSSITVSIAGTYFVEAKGANGCTRTASAIVT
jgi:hypothetical protein